MYSTSVVIGQLYTVVRQYCGSKEHLLIFMSTRMFPSIYLFNTSIFSLQKSYVCNVESVDADNLVIDMNKDLVALEDIVATNLAPHKFK